LQSVPSAPMIADRHEVVERLVVEVRVDVERLFLGKHHGQPRWGDGDCLRAHQSKTHVAWQTILKLTLVQIR